MTEELHKVIVGQDAVIEQILAAIFTGGHCLLVGVPGLAKTLLVSTIARILDVRFKRIQFTPDLMPSDITGTNVLEEAEAGKRHFRFVEGPVFTNVLLADEINRTPPKTQAALLQAMQEHEVTIGQTTYPLPEPFFVIATQNPYEFEGTYPLPENQLDRFTLCMEVGYPSRQAEKQALTLHRQGEPVEDLKPVVTQAQLLAIQQEVRQVAVEESLQNYLLDLIEATRRHEQLSLGLSTRGALTLYRACQAWAKVEGRDYLVPDDVKRMFPSVVAHRVLCRGSIRLGQRTRARAILEEILQRTPVPR